jgi:hemolysin III
MASFFAAVPLGVALALSTDDPVARAAAIAFAVSVVTMFGVSSLFHRIAWQPRAKRWVGRIDHTMIYALIAGTYTPIGLLVVHRGWRVPILAVVWGGALAASVVTFAWPRRPAWIAPATCLALGWVAVVVLPQIVDGIGVVGTSLLVAGGLAYSAGAVVYARRRPDPVPHAFGYHEVFHALVVTAVACQYAVIAFYVLPLA